MRTRRTISIHVVLILTTSVICKEGVRGELSRLQRQTGLTLAWYYSGVNTGHFADRSASTDNSKPPSRHENGLLSPDASEIAFPTSGPEYHDQPHLTIVRRDGTIIAQYLELQDANALCWSHDKSKLVTRAKTADTRPPQYHLFVLDLASHAATQFGEDQSYASPQCWSPDDKKIAFQTGEDVRIYELSSANSSSIAPGWEPAWSPDGQKIALWRKDGYYSISPVGGELKQLFKTKQGRSGLFWSPDSRFVAYLGEGGTFRETLRYLDVGLVQLRVRRLSDGSEDWLWQTPDVPPAHSLQFVWVNLPHTK